MALDFAAAVLLGILAALTELVSRYRDAPSRALLNWPAALYVSLNGAAAAAVLALIHAQPGTFGVSARWTEVLSAGIGAMGLFRTSLFTVRAGDKDIAIGPATFLQALRDAADRAVDRLRAKARLLLMEDLMTGIDYQKASTGLSVLCLTMMQNVPDDEQQKLLKAAKVLDADPMGAAMKARILGLYLMGVVGPDVLTAAVGALRKELMAAPPGQAGATTA